jgi:tetratricopeptide (TPR) repeat protein
MLAIMKSAFSFTGISTFFIGAIVLGASPQSAHAQLQLPPQASVPSSVSQLNDRMIVMGVLAAEFALQSGDLPTAAGTYAEMARRSADPKVSERAVELLLRGRRLEEAKEIVAIWQKSEPNSPRANQISLALALGSADEAGAMKAVSRAVAFPVETRGAAIVDLSRQLAQHGNRDFAVKLASIFTETMPELAESHYALSVASAGTDNTRLNESLLAIDKALAIKPNWPQAVAVKARLLAFKAEKSPRTRVATETKKKSESVTLLEEAVAANASVATAAPGTTDNDARELKLLLARVQFDERNFSEARKLFLDLSDDGKEDSEEMQLSATLSAFSAQDWDTSEKEFSEALASERGDANAIRYYLARVSEGRKRWPEAAERYAQVQRAGVGDRYWESQLRIAGALALDKRLTAAMNHLAALKPANAIEKTALVQTEAALWKEAGEHSKALEVLDKALATDEKNTDLLYESAMIAERLNQFADSEKKLRRVLELEPNRADANNALGYGLADRNERLDEARALIEKAYKAAPEDAAILDSMGWVAFRQGRLKEAEEFLRKSYARFQDGEVAAHLGEVLWAQGRKADARETWQTQLKIQPDSEILKQTMKRLDP